METAADTSGENTGKSIQIESASQSWIGKEIAAKVAAAKEAFDVQAGRLAWLHLPRIKKR